MALVGAVAESSGEVFYHNTVDTPGLHITHHALKVTALYVGCGPIVYVSVYDLL